MVCKVKGCESLGVTSRGKQYLMKGMCRPHYRRFKKYGDPFGGKRFDGEAITHFFNTYMIETDRCIM